VLTVAIVKPDVVAFVEDTVVTTYTQALFCGAVAVDSENAHLFVFVFEQIFCSRVCGTRVLAAVAGVCCWTYVRLGFVF
jgi:hypothetical protein